MFGPATIRARRRGSPQARVEGRAGIERRVGMVALVDHHDRKTARLLLLEPVERPREAGRAVSVQTITAKEVSGARMRPMLRAGRGSERMH